MPLFDAYLTAQIVSFGKLSDGIFERFLWNWTQRRGFMKSFDAMIDLKNATVVLMEDLERHLAKYEQMLIEMREAREQLIASY